MTAIFFSLTCFAFVWKIFNIFTHKNWIFLHDIFKNRIILNRKTDAIHFFFHSSDNFYAYEKYDEIHYKLGATIDCVGCWTGCSTGQLSKNCNRIRWTKCFDFNNIFMSFNLELHVCFSWDFVMKISFSKKIAQFTWFHHKSKEQIKL